MEIDTVNRERNRIPFWTIKCNFWIPTHFLNCWNSTAKKHIHLKIVYISLQFRLIEKTTDSTLLTVTHHSWFQRNNPKHDQVLYSRVLLSEVSIIPLFLCVTLFSQVNLLESNVIFTHAAYPNKPAGHETVGGDGFKILGNWTFHEVSIFPCCWVEEKR